MIDDRVLEEQEIDAIDGLYISSIFSDYQFINLLFRIEVFLLIHFVKIKKHFVSLLNLFYHPLDQQ